VEVVTAGSPQTARPTLIFFHGGGWVEGGGTKAALLTSLPYIAMGMDMVYVDYRIAPQSLAPAAVQDSRCALHWVYEHAKDYGFDTTKIVVTGQSAGGHLALMTGMLDPSAGLDNECTRPENDWRSGAIQDVKVAAIVDFFGPTDVADLIQGPNIRGYAVRWLGSQPDRMEVAKQVSPLTYVHKGLPPILEIHGDKDAIVPYEHAVKLHEALDREGVPNQLITVPGGGHGEWTHQQNLEVQNAVIAFLRKYGIVSP
jgi:acetyl esterase/lipase